MIWTMCGICLISLFTASVTTIMGEVIGGGVKEHTIENSVVGVIRGSIERHLVLQNGGKPIGVIPKYLPKRDFIKYIIQTIS